MIARVAIAAIGLHSLGAALRCAPHARSSNLPGRARDALASPTSIVVGLVLAYAAALQSYGLPILLALAFALRAEREVLPAGRMPLGAVIALGALAAGVLARPMTPTFWDEFVWLGKARLESVGFGAGVREALDPATHLMPPGYPMFWPGAVGWLAGGQDELAALTLASSVLNLATFGAAVEAWSAHRFAFPRVALVLVLATPFIVVHARSTYVDLPLGLLGLALTLELTGPRRSSLVASALAVALACTKDEGVAHIAGAVTAGLFCHRGEARRPAWFAASAGSIATLAWHAALAMHAVPRDHAGSVLTPQFAPRALTLLALHATDLRTWGLFWALAAAAVPFAIRSSQGRALTLALGVELALAVAALCAGSPRVRAFAENGTLVNRILLQFWPLGAALVLEAARPGEPAKVEVTDDPRA
jgi:hypothetical protein